MKNLPAENQVRGAVGEAGAAGAWGTVGAASAQFTVGAVGFGPIADDDDAVQLTHAGWKRVTDRMAESIVRLQNELDEANARIAVLEEEQKILAKGFPSPAKAAVIEGVEQQDLPAGVSRIGCHERPEPSPQFSDTPETDAAIIVQIGRLATAVVDVEFARALERERDEALAEVERLRNKVFEERLAQLEVLRLGNKHIAELTDEVEMLRAALQRLADCDFVITPHDRMDAVRKIARDALEAAK